MVIVAEPVSGSSVIICDVAVDIVVLDGGGGGGGTGTRKLEKAEV